MKKIVIKFMKNTVLFFLNIVFRILWIFPVRNNRVFFMSYSGNQYACSPKYVSERLLEQHGDKIDIVWALKSVRGDIPSSYRIVRPGSFEYYKALLTSKVIIHNVYIPPWLPYRSSQTIINTWHGGSLGKLPYSNFDDLSWYNKRLLRSGTAYFVSSSKRFSEEVIRGTFADTREILEIGLPRNDVFFAADSESFPVHDHYGLSHDTDIVLYAPTYRDVESKLFVPLDLEALAAEWAQKTGNKTVVLARMHPLSADRVIETENVLDGSTYPDMQDILIEAACLITDYSSAMWDYCLMGRPCILYLPDEDEYVSNRGMYLRSSMYRLPYGINQEEIHNIIRTFSQNDYAAADRAYQDLLGSVESGRATEIMAELVTNIMRENNEEKL